MRAAGGGEEGGGKGGGEGGGEGGGGGGGEGGGEGEGREEEREEGREEEREEGRKEVRQLNCRQSSGLNNTLISIFRIQDESSPGICKYMYIYIYSSTCDFISQMHQNQS